MEKIVLIQPKSGEWEFAGIRPPDSLLSVAAVPYKKGYEIKIIDQRTDKGWKTTLKKELKDALCVGITSMTGPQLRYALEAARFVKENSDVTVVWGGIHGSLMPEQTIKSKYIDILVTGEGDYSFAEVVEALEEGKGLSNIKGLYYKEKGEINNTGRRKLIAKLDELPDLPYGLIDIEKYYGFDINAGRSITLMTSRGCPFRCAFCYNTTYYRNTWRGMSAKRTIEKIKYVVDNFGIKNIFFQDDNFCANLKRFEDIVNGILKEKIDITWGLMGARVSSLKLMSDSLLDKAVKAGCVNVDVGIESGSERILKLISKDNTIPEILAVNKKLAKHFYRMKYTFIMGIPTETEEELLQSVRFAIKLCKDNPHVLPLFFVYCAYPGTSLCNLALRHGFKEPKNLEEWSEINYETAHLHYPWLDKKRIKMLKNFEFASLFASKNNDYKIKSPFFKLMARLYRPIAKLRFEKNIYQFPMEIKIIRKISHSLE
ncbi:MAG: B12-binding domain-containing radical SAM protein [Proteobacteria bacterium]|nr:B12-binding domain-containing radical SAM protein [Desulfobacteraceae bacterium]MBU3979736.1 B12-binding domain-containing radical SAM protein [Pseudomonadota bacterium]MBU4012875.1 B12-binding domain-containing radical SAM protein [Pseudomonadota bacterium]MBU4068677.1 B12-binding domain-containing radical SAM protein [Pseudomonadota bacterium]MBU4101367.1 B12-binding domain-containing radical SAM protein [Pseudomonadota bacterium]